MINWNIVPYWVRVIYFKDNTYFYANRYPNPTEIDIAPNFKFNIPKKYLEKLYFYNHYHEDTFIKFESGNVVECFDDKWFICHDELPCGGEYWEGAFESSRLEDIMHREFGDDYFIELYKEGGK